MKTRLLSLLVFAALNVSHATSVSLSNQPQGRSVVDFDNLAVPDGSLVLVGTFSNISALANVPPDQLASDAGWTQFGSSLATQTVFGNPGKLVGTTTDLSAAAFNGKPIYLWIFDGPTIASSTSYGVFTASSGVPAWNFPTNNGGIGDLITISADDSSLSAVAGLGSVDGAQIRLVSIASVPEPAAVGLLGMGIALLLPRTGLLRLRRK